MADLNDLHARLVADLDTPEGIRAAFAAHPRHRFIPDMIWPSAMGLPLYRTADPEKWARIVYTDDAVTTQANDGGSGPVNRPTSSSSAPQLMADMIDAANIAPGMRVLEIGTGTGWNAAILSTLVGPAGSVTSVEIDPGVAAAARERLARTGVRVVTGTTAPGTDTYDAAIATCAVSNVPLEWTERLGQDAPLVVPWTPYADSGPTPIVVLRETGDVLAGPFVRDAAFMRNRVQRAPRQRFPGTGAEPDGVGRFPLGSVELLDRDLLTRLVLVCPSMRIDVGGRPWNGRSAPVIALGAGDSWVYIWPDGTVTYGGDASLLERFTVGYESLDSAGWPGLDEFSLEVDPKTEVCRVRAPFGAWEHRVGR
ncbi:protein-L-isoaspartate(D-aspartate) O-methyltransferase [Nocardiopsis sp. EMB25]|uniref:rRNA adenine N-6-methyltransferase family protein n=1 Tax=Nocardiopsis sp. EMB25 TaxID=2835867 RepID=UPI002284C82E|nr:rRNA adenine N-6-methyltransferase family protein [Nocardiopsis sp. EMB25]MCY9786338.1 protein-L-isoaspartate(D-aspartate) O-methyltransferase [Nocardiopsis sp. EMB25]